MNSGLNKKITQASSKLNSQVKSSDSIIPTLKLAKASFFSSSLAQSYSQIQKQKLGINTLPLQQPGLQVHLNRPSPQLNQVGQNVNSFQIQQKVLSRPMTAIQNKTIQNLQEEIQLTKQVRPTTSNSSSLNLNKQIQSKNTAATKSFVKVDGIVNLQNKQIKSTFQLTRPSSSQQSSISQIQKSNEIMLRNIMSAKSTISKSKDQIKLNKNPISTQQASIQKKQTFQNNNNNSLNNNNNINKNSINNNNVMNNNNNNNKIQHLQIQEEEEEEKEGFDFFQKEQDNNIQQAQEQNTFEKINEEQQFSILQYLKPEIPQLPPPPFFEVMNYEITLKISNFLLIEDFILLAQVSRQARNLVAMALKKLDYTDKTTEYHRNKYKAEFNAVQRIKQIQQNFDNFLQDNKNFEKEFLIFLRKRNPNQNEIFQTLQAGINYTNNKLNTSLDIVSTIKSKGIKNCFLGITVPFMPPSDLKIVIPSSLPLKNSVFEQFIKIIYSYAEFRKTNKVTVQNQKQAFLQMAQFKVHSKFMDGKLKLQAMYLKPIQRLRKSSNIYDFINKNTLQVIIKFLTFKEIIILFQTGKTMRQVVKSVLQNQLNYLQSNREDQLISLGLSPQFGDGILYAKQFEEFEIDLVSYISSQRFSYDNLREQLKAICFALTSKTLEEVDAQFKANPTIIYKVNLNYSVPHPDRLLLINSFLEKYPFLKEFKEKILNDQKASLYDKRECILLYLAMKGFQKLAQFRENYSNFEDANVSYDITISPLDQIIFKYKKLLEIEDEIYMIPQYQLPREPLIFEGEAILLLSN